MRGVDEGRGERAGWLVVCCVLVLALGACGGGDDDGDDTPSDTGDQDGGQAGSGEPGSEDGGAGSGGGEAGSGSTPGGRLTEPLPPGEPIERPRARGPGSTSPARAA